MKFDWLPQEIVQLIYSFDPTHHSHFKKEVLGELAVNRQIHAILSHDLDQLLFSPSYRAVVLQRFSKEDLGRYARSIGIYITRRMTKRRLLALLSAYKLQNMDDQWYMENGAQLWLFL